MIYQKLGELIKDIQDVGCYYLVFLRWNEMLFDYVISYEQANNWWEVVKRRGDIGNNIHSTKYRCMIKPDNVLNFVKTQVNPEAKGIWAQIGETVDGKTTYWPWVNEKHKAAPRYIAAQEKTGGDIGTHFIWVNNIEDKIIMYDSWNLARIGEKSNATRFLHYAYLG